MSDAAMNHLGTVFAFLTAILCFVTAVIEARNKRSTTPVFKI